MMLSDVVRFLDLMYDLDVRVWLDGGWGVDACLGEQTRRHGDLDIVVEDRDAPMVAAALRDRGYVDVHRDDTSAWNFVLGDDAGHEVDFHVIVLDAAGDGVYGPPENRARFPAEALTGVGTIDGRAVSCITPEWLVRFHSGYPLKDKDWADVSALCTRFCIEIPADHWRFRQRH